MEQRSASAEPGRRAGAPRRAGRPAGSRTDDQTAGHSDNENPTGRGGPDDDLSPTVEASPTSGVGVLDKAALVLTAVEAGPAALGELVARTGLSRATAHRLAVALAAHRLVGRDGAGRFVAGPRLATGSPATALWPLPWAVLAAAPAVLAELRDATGESTQLYVRRGTERICVAAAERSSGLRDTVPVGATLPMTAGSGAQVLLAYAATSTATGTATSTATSRAAGLDRAWGAGNASARDPDGPRHDATTEGDDAALGPGGAPGAPGAPDGTYERTAGAIQGAAALRGTAGRPTTTPVASVPVPPGAVFDAAALAAVRRRGWAESVGEREPGLASVSAPVRDAAGSVIAAVSLSGPDGRLTRSPGQRHGAAVVAAADRLSQAAGHPPAAHPTTPEGIRTSPTA
jgi:DNA-binding IclR family transcriptional regulator